MHQDTEIYQTVEKLGDVVLAAASHMPRHVKPVLGGRLFDETVAMALLVRDAAIARDADKVPIYNQLLGSLEAMQFMLRRSQAAGFLRNSHYAATMPLTASIGKQAIALRNHFAPAL